MGDMSVIGSSIETSALQAIQAQHIASKARDREKNESAGGRRFADLVELRVSAVQSVEAPRGLPGNDSEQSDQERDSRRQQQAGYARVVDEQSAQPHIDVQA